MNAYLATVHDLADIRKAYVIASLHCSPDAPAIPPDDVLVSNVGTHLYVARNERGLVAGTVIMDQHRPDFVWWLTIVDRVNAAEVWAALGDVIAKDRGVDPHGHVSNPELRVLLLVHPRLNNEDESDVTHLTWRQDGDNR